MAVLDPHLVRAARIHTRLAEVTDRTRALEGALDALSFGILTCTGDGRIMTMSRRAEWLFAADGPLRPKGRRLSARAERETERLWKLIERAAEAARGIGAGGGGAVALRGADPSERPMTATIAPISGRIDASITGDASATASVVVLVSHPEQPLDVPESVLGELYGLTPAELRLALALARGDSVEEAADQLGLAIGTARWRLKQIQAKTDTRRQGALASLVLRSVGVLAVSGRP
ncbi:MAG: hypothetical protein KC616_14330 [Myxococcales bacterium]|nr:hypothetical protein [Myxococcales bacterium]